MNYKNEAQRHLNGCGCQCHRISERQTPFHYSTQGKSAQGHCAQREQQRKSKDTCRQSNGPLSDDTPIAMVYSPVQVWKELYDPATALDRGTLFKELDLPFYPTPCKRKECGQCR